MSLDKLYLSSSGPDIIQKLKEKKLICDKAVCEGSEAKKHEPKEMKFVPRNDCADGYNWRCNYCSTHRGIRGKSFFEYSRLKLEILFKLMINWVLMTRYKGLK